MTVQNSSPTLLCLAATSRRRWRGTLLYIAGVSGLILGCSDSPREPFQEQPDAAGLIEDESRAPLCSDIAMPQAPNALFTHGIIDANEISETIMLGDMDPTSPQEVLNFEMGFYVPGVEVPLVAPAKLYLQSIERSYHANDDVTDFGVGYHVCSYDDAGVRKAAVSGNFAHVAALNSELTALFDAELRKLKDGQESSVRCSGDTTEECSLFVSMLRDQAGDPSLTLIVEAGSQLGLTGHLEGNLGPAGIDANLQDRRINDFSGNYYINPNRLGADNGPGAGWRYGACTYDYFVEPFRTQYLDMIRNVGVARVSADQPCGTVEIDEGVEGTLGGMWALDSVGTQIMSGDLGGQALDDYLINLLALADHLTFPETKMMLSTSLQQLSQITNEPSLIEFDKAIEFDADWNNEVNVPFALAQPGITYCYAGQRYHGNQDAFYLAELSQNGTTMQFEKVVEDCRGLTADSRVFDTQSDAYFSFVR